MGPVGKHSRARVRRAPRQSPGRLLGLGLGVLATFAAWCVLVYYAIQLGPQARSGTMAAWALLLVATLGAIGCLFLALILGGRIVELIRGASRTPAVAGRRIKR